MARKRPVHDALVQAALARQRSAGAKISRLRRNGVDPTTIDPRQSAAEVRAMSNAQLRKYTDRLDSFVRNRGYVAGVNGTPINRTAFEYLKRLERQNNKIVADFEAKVGSVTVPTLGEQTVASQIERRNREKFVAGGERATFQTQNRQASDITSQTSIMTLIDNMKNKLSPGYFDTRLSTTRQNIEQMLEMVGDEQLIASLKEISNESLNTMVDYSPFMKSLSARYEYMKKMNSDEEYQPENWMQDVFDQSLDEVKDFLEWGRKLNSNESSTVSEYTDTNARAIPIQRRGEYTDTTARPVPIQRPNGKPGKPGKRK